MPELGIEKIESILRDAISPEIRRQFERNFGNYGNYFRVEDKHPWTKPDGLVAYTQVMRGEIELPHAPYEYDEYRPEYINCIQCYMVFVKQLELLRSMGILAKHSDQYYSSRRKLISQRLRELAEVLSQDHMSILYASTSIYPSTPYPSPNIFVTLATYSPDYGVDFSAKSDHPWLEEDGLTAHIRIMRGDDNLPHLPSDCNECRKIFQAQVILLKEHNMYASCGPKRHKRNPGRQKLFKRIGRVRECLQKLAAKQIQETV